MRRLSLEGHRICAIDFETTGLIGGWHDPVEIAVVPLDVRLRPMAGVTPFVSFMRPERPERADPGAMQVHRIPMDTLLVAPEAAEVAEQLASWIETLGLKSGGQVIPLAHNWAFEWSFLVPWLGIETCGQWFHRRARDSMTLAAALSDAKQLAGLVPSFAGVSLADLTRHFGLTNLTPHRALGDAIVEAEVYRRLLESVSGV